MKSIRGRVWWALVSVAILLMVFGVVDVLSGVAADPGITLGLSGLSLAELEAQGGAGYRLYDFVTRGLGLALIVTGALLTAILLVPYRAGERWAWYTMWLLPAWSAAVPVLYLSFGVVPDQPPPPPMVSGPILAVLCGLVLLLDRPRFFDREVNETEHLTGVPSWTGG